MADLLLGIDVGTQATKAILLDRSGQQTAVAHEEYQVDLPDLLWAEQWPEVWMQAVVTTIRRLIAESRIQPDRIAGVCISSLYGGKRHPSGRRDEAGQAVPDLDGSTSNRAGGANQERRRYRRVARHNGKLG